jgi:hypothetical protein
MPSSINTHHFRVAKSLPLKASTNWLPASCHSLDALERLTPGEFGLIDSTSRVLTPDMIA